MPRLLLHTYIRTGNIRIEARVFISYSLFLTWRLNETGVYSGPGIYFVNTQGEEVHCGLTGAIMLI